MANDEKSFFGLDGAVAGNGSSPDSRSGPPVGPFFLLPSSEVLLLLLLPSVRLFDDDDDEEEEAAAPLPVRDWLAVPPSALSRLDLFPGEGKYSGIGEGRRFRPTIRRYVTQRSVQLW